MKYRAKSVDRRYNDWHYSLPGRVDYIDLDGVEDCWDCRDPLALVETTTNPEKSTSILRKLAARAGVPAWLVILPRSRQEIPGCTECGRPPSAVPLEDDDLVRVACIYSPGGERDRERRTLTLAEWGTYLTELHDEHSRRACRAQTRRAEIRRGSSGGR